jgi:NtrC-family two-component system response regulator AlgB
LFLDEIGEISPALQAKLLRFVQDREFERVGETRTRRADVRIVAATNRELEADVKAGRFREDLLFRLNVIEARVPPLRERHEDVLTLARGFFRFFGLRQGRVGCEIDAPASQALLAYGWPGNVRELRNVIERAAILFPAGVLGLHMLPRHIAAALPSAAPPAPVYEVGGDVSLEQLEREHIMRVLARVPTLDDAARVLGIDASTLWRKRKKYEEPPDHS